MGLLKWALAGAAGYGLYRAMNTGDGDGAPVAFANGEHAGDNFSQVRSAGTEGMRSNPKVWDKTDHALDESFPASDPPSTY
ncbi:hypothetical protein [Novosphingobium sp.]|uniref:hypothetical protein n=1 Tax=Novosphingobium sp. TaxID=1874826 RepID=UPI0025FCF8D6|nr:hypothetical protein [Novosphingobium sp.]